MIPDDQSRKTHQRAGSRVRTAFIVCGVSIAVLAAFQLATGGTSSVPSLGAADYAAHPETAEGPAPNFSLPALSGGGKITLESVRGSISVMNFWASWCAPCRAEAPALEATAEAYRARGVQFLGVDERDDATAARAFQHEFGITYPSAADPTGSLAGDFRLFGLPTTYVISADGRLLYEFTGHVNGATLRTTLDSVLKPAATGT